MNDTEKHAIPFYHLKWRSVRGHKQKWYGVVYDKRGIIHKMRKLIAWNGGKNFGEALEGKLSYMEDNVNEKVHITFKTKKRVYSIIPVMVDTGAPIDMNELESDMMDTMHRAFKQMEGGGQ